MSQRRRLASNLFFAAAAACLLTLALGGGTAQAQDDEDPEETTTTTAGSTTSTTGEIVDQDPTTTTIGGPTTTTTAPPPDCHPAYTSPCLPPDFDDIDCGDLNGQQVVLVDPADDPYQLDGDNDGVGCEPGDPADPGDPAPTTAPTTPTTSVTPTTVIVVDPGDPTAQAVANAQIVVQRQVLVNPTTATGVRVLAATGAEEMLVPGLGWRLSNGLLAGFAAALIAEGLWFRYAGPTLLRRESAASD